MLFQITSISFAKIRTSTTLVARRDSVLKEIFPPGSHKLYFPQILLKIASDM